MVERQHGVELVAGLELEEQRAEGRAGEHRAGVGDAAGLGQARGAGREDVDEVAAGIHADASSERRSFRYAVLELPQFEADDAQGREPIEGADAGEELRLNQGESPARGHDRVLQRRALEVTVDERRRGAEARDPEQHTEVTRRVVAEEHHDVAGPDAIVGEHGRNARYPLVHVTPGQLLVAHLERERIGIDPGVLGDHALDALVAPFARAHQPGQRLGRCDGHGVQRRAQGLAEERVVPAADDVGERRPSERPTRSKTPEACAR